MDMEYSAIRYSDKPYTTYGTSGPRARDGIRMAEIVHGGREAIEAEPALMGIVNPNSPLIWDFRMTDALIAWAEAKQPIVVTPFLLAGATSAVSVSGGLAQQVAEALSGVALAQLVREGVPCLYGSFFTVTDMRTGSPAFGTPESVWGMLAGAQLARRYGLPFRGGGGLASSPAVDAQAAAETQMMLWATNLAATDVVLHAAGWLEGGLTASFEKFALDVEMLRQFQVQARGHRVQRGGDRVRRPEGDRPGRAVPRPRRTRGRTSRSGSTCRPLFQTPDFATWETMGSETTEVAANRAWKQLLETYEDPGLDPAIDEELQAYIASRRDAPDLYVED